MNKKTTTIVSIAVILLISIVFAFVANGFLKKGNVSDTDNTPSQTDASENSQTETDNTGETEPSAPVEKPKPQFITAPDGYFENALFIGDSRTVGLCEYGGIDGATFFASVGLSVYKVNDEVVSVKNVGEFTLAELLNQRQFNSIYIMLGINEMGYNRETTIKKYTELVNTVRSLQPNAVIFIQANIHVSKTKGDENPVFKNSSIDEFNLTVGSLADGENIFYIDPNELFDDEYGNLDSQYSFDGVHLLGKNYITWAQWLATKAIVK